MIKDAVDPSKVARGNRTTAAPGGIEWTGDPNAEFQFVFGTSWADSLIGGMNNDSLYGFEADDLIEGGFGSDKLFGDAGNDILYAESRANVASEYGDEIGDANLLSGGTGNDRLYGSRGPDILFGGPGHDFLYGGYGSTDEDLGTRELHGGDGDDEIWASHYGDNEITGGAGDDMILAGLNEAGGLTQETFPNMPRRSTLPAIGENEREDYASYGNLDIDGGDGNDFIIGGFGANDIFGGKGDDVIYGS